MSSNYVVKDAKGQNDRGDTYTPYGAMIFGEYTDDDKTNMQTKKDATDTGYGNRTAIDIWTKYEIKQDKILSIGVRSAEPEPAYVSFIAENGETIQEDLKISHLKYKDETLVEGHDKIAGSTDLMKGEKDIYGNTISTGFLAKFTSGIEANNYIRWEITVPPTPEEGSYGETYIKLDKKVNLSEAELTAAELYDSFFGVTDDFAGDDEIFDVGDEVFGDEFAQESESDTAVDMTQGVDESNGFFDDEAAQQFLLDLSEANGSGNSGVGAISVDANPVLEDTSSSIYNAGNIHKVSFSNGGYKMKIDQKLDVTITGGTVVTIGLVIDNLYAPNAYAKVTGPDANAENAYQTITDAINSRSYRDYLEKEDDLNNWTPAAGYDKELNANYVETPYKVPNGSTSYFSFDGDLNDIISGTTGTPAREKITEGAAPTEILYDDEGYNGKAVKFNGSGSYGVNLGKVITNPQYTVAFRMKANAFTQHTSGIFVNSGSKANEDWLSAPFGQKTGGGTMIWSRKLPAAHNTSFKENSWGTMQVNTWYHIVVAVDGINAALYIDGVKTTGSGTVDNSVTENTETYLGVNFWDVPFNGLIDDLYIYNGTTLDDTQVEALYAAMNI